MNTGAAWFVEAVLFAGFCHACWHTLLKSGGDQLRTIAAVYGLGALVCAVAVPFVPRPSAPAFGYMALSVLLHCGSYVYIARAYTLTHLNQALPLHRGLAPMMVAAGAWLFTGEIPGLFAGAGLVLAAGGVAWLAFEGGPPWRGGRVPVLPLVLSAAFVAAYTVVDGLGVRAAGTSAGYVVWLFLFNGPAVMLVARAAAPGTGHDGARLPWSRLLSASVLALVAHGLVIWAMSVGPLATVAALRETSVIFAAVIGTLALGEPFGRTASRRRWRSAWG